MSRIKKKTMVSSHVTFPPEVLGRLERLRKRLEKNGPATMSQAIRMAVVQGLDTLEGA